MKNKKQPSGLSTVAIVIISLLIGFAIIALIAVAFVFFVNSQSTSSGTQKVLTNSWPSNGGACQYYRYDSSGKKLNECVDEASVEKAVAMLPDNNSAVIDTSALIEINGTTHTSTQSRSSTTVQPTSSQLNVIIFDSIRSVSKSSVKIQN